MRDAAEAVVMAARSPQSSMALEKNWHFFPVAWKLRPACGIPHVQILRRFAEDVTKGNGRMVQAGRYLVNLA